MSSEVVCLTILPDGSVGGGWGRAQTVAVGRVNDGVVADWEVIDVGWGELHDSGTHGSHHARMVKFLREHEVTVVGTGHMGDGMQNTITKMGLRIVMGLTGDPKTAAAAISQTL